VSNSVALTKKVDHAELVAELVAAGVTVGISIDCTRITCGGAIWDAMSAEDQAAEILLIAVTEAAHVPTTVSTVSLAAKPHMATFIAELQAVSGVTNVGVILPETYPGVCTLGHNSLTPEQKVALTSAAEEHDASGVPSLSAVPTSLVVAANGSDTGQVTIVDSRGSAAVGKLVRITIPVGVAMTMDNDVYPMDANGRAVITFGETSFPTGEIPLVASYDTGEADVANFTVRRGTP
jgi:hypothetical protein